MKSFSYEWKSDKCAEEDGVIVGLSRNHEWMLEWWFTNYSRTNSHPVTFVDFGDMSPEAKEWCRAHGGLVSLEIDTNLFVVDRSKLTPEAIALWESTVTGEDIWKSRQEFFKKPFACLASPYRRTIWLDTDCQVLKSIAPIFAFCNNPQGIALAEEPPIVLLKHKQDGLLEPDELEYNTGVVVFERNCSVIPTWARYCVESSTCLRGDQEALSRWAYENDVHLPSIPMIYNWRANIVPSEELMQEIVVLHCLGAYKQLIRRQIGLEQ